MIPRLRYMLHQHHMNLKWQNRKTEFCFKGKIYRYSKKQCIRTDNNNCVVFSFESKTIDSGL